MSEDEGRQLPVWFALRDLERGFLAMLALAPSDPGRPELWVDYEESRVELESAIVAFKASLVLVLGDDADVRVSVSEKCFSCLLIHYDERELATIDVENRPTQTPLLQTQYCGIYNGGEVFVANLENALRASNSPILYIELLLFCMRSGFCGSYATLEDPERQAKMREICERVAAAGPTPPADREPPPPIQAIEGIGFPYGYYLGAAAFLSCLWFMLLMRAGQHEDAILGSKACQMK